MDLQSITVAISRTVAFRDVLRAAAHLTDDTAVKTKIGEAQAQLSLILIDLLRVQADVFRQDKEIKDLRQQIKTGTRRSLQRR